MVDASKRDDLSVDTDQNGQRRNHHDTQAERIGNSCAAGVISGQRVSCHTAHYHQNENNAHCNYDRVTQRAKKFAAVQRRGKVSEIKVGGESTDGCQDLLAI